MSTQTSLDRFVESIDDTPHKPATTTTPTSTTMTTTNVIDLCGDGASEEEVVIQAVREITCPMCGTMNKDVEQCYICATNLVSNASIPCPKCTYDNPPTVLTCQMCRNPLVVGTPGLFANVSGGKPARGVKRKTRPKQTVRPMPKLGSRDNVSWTEAVTPYSRTDLAIHAKKLKEYDFWYQHQAHRSAPILLLTGPPGIGKTSLVKACARDDGVAVCEYREPDNPIWSQRYLGGENTIPYVSKEQSLSEFLTAGSRYKDVLASLANPTADDTANDDDDRILLIDDILTIVPLGKYEGTLKLLERYSRRSTVPLVIIASTCESTDLRVTRFMTELSTLPNVHRIKVNPVANTLLTRALNKVMDLYKIPRDSGVVSNIVESSRGDLRHAVNTLQFYHLGTLGNRSAKADFPSLGHALSSWEWSSGKGKRKGKGKGKGKRRKGSNAISLDTSPTHSPPTTTTTTTTTTTSFNHHAHAADHQLSLFHSLGRLLYAKRNEDGTLKNTPETVLEEGGAAADPSMFTAFLHQNYLSFIAPTAIEDASLSLDYQSESDIFQSRWQHPAASSYALSIAARGIIHANQHKVQPGFNAIRGPQEPKVRRGARAVQSELNVYRDTVTCDTLHLPSIHEIATVYAPVARTAYGHVLRERQPFTSGKYTRVFDAQYGRMPLDGQLRGKTIHVHAGAERGGERGEKGERGERDGGSSTSNDGVEGCTDGSVAPADGVILDPYGQVEDIEDD